MPHLELHIHTKAGSADSSISVDTLGRCAAEMETGGLVVTEHFRVWNDWEREAFEARWGIRLYPAVEVTTDRGHIIVVGAQPEVKLPGDAGALLAVVAARGWFAIAAHPFRHYFDGIHTSQRPHFPPDLDASDLAQQPHFAAVDAIEVRNAVCTDRENELASAVALALDMPITFGSDAHHLDEIGRQRMKVDTLPSSVADLCDLLRSWRPSASAPAD